MILHKIEKTWNKIYTCTALKVFLILFKIISAHCVKIYNFLQA